MKREADVVLINPGDRKQVYQTLGYEYPAVEPPYILAALAAYLRNNDVRVAVIDANADNLAPEEVAAEVDGLTPLVAAVIVYGNQPSASTQNMTIAGRICTSLRQHGATKVAIGGLHPTALPGQTMNHEDVDFLIEGEGTFTLLPLVKELQRGGSDFSRVPGLWYWFDSQLRHNQRATLAENLDEALPIAAWDLLPMDKYKAHNWHCFDNIEQRAPYGAIYTSLGCPYNCLFCCINTPFGKPGIRYRSPQLVVDEIGLLVEKYNVKNVKFVDELFVLHDYHYMSIVDLIIRKGYDLNIWAYARVDTVKPGNLKKMKQAGINWLALGIESANPGVRDGASKKMKVRDIRSVVQSIFDEGIRIIGNFIFGLPDDTIETMEETLDMAVELRCEFANFYCAMAYPGSKLYDIALKEGWELPESWHGYSQHSYETHPLPTKYVSAKEVLKFRDNAFHKYFEDEGYLSMIEEKFGPSVRAYLMNMTKIRLKRKLLEI
ncbi:MAG: radical SAM protein [Nitrospirae bacterium]|nr:radical SAM protein [Nitrospirota bacterium]